MLSASIATVSVPLVHCSNHRSRSIAMATSPRAASATRRDLLSASLTLPLIATAVAPSAALADEVALTETSSGLAYADLLVGSGASPVKGATVRCHYRGTLENGAVFDSSYERRRPLAFTVGVGQVIKGWDRGILGDEVRIKFLDAERGGERRRMPMADASRYPLCCRRFRR